MRLANLAPTVAFSAGLALTGSLAQVQTTVLAAAREYLGNNGAGPSRG